MESSVFTSHSLITYTASLHKVGCTHLNSHKFELALDVVGFKINSGWQYQVGSST